MRHLFCCTLLFTFFSFALSGQILIGISGGTGSGKTTLAEQIEKHFQDEALLLEQDSYYKDWSHFPPEERESINFDHPESLDFQLLKQHLLDLKNGKPISRPIYDFITHTRQKEFQDVSPKKLVIVEGILLFTDPKIRDLFDIRLYVETDDDIRILRRLERDIKERGRHFESVKKQYIETVKPMHKKFVEPSKNFADVVIYGINENLPLVTKLISGYMEKDDGICTITD